MRLLELQLLAYGPFSDVSLDFELQPALHLVYGPNEAGKSTALRAIGGLLYGIPVNTGDAHIHRMEDLRIGARLANRTESLSVVRRKGRKNTLLDPSGAALDEMVLERLLGGVDEATFAAMFGLDHESLRRGAEALLQGRGGVGESLFDAGTGGRGIQSVLAELNEEADELFRPRGRNQKVNEALSALAEARRRKNENELSADAWRTQVETLEADRAEREELLAEQRALAAQQSSLQRTLRVLPHLARWRDTRARRAALGDVVILPGEARELRQVVQRDLDECARRVAGLRQEVDEREARRAALNVPESLTALDEEVIESLTGDLGSYRKAAVDLPKREGELGILRAEVERLQRGLGSGAVAEAEERRLPAPAQALIRKLANERSGLQAAHEHDRGRLADLEVKLEGERERLAAIGEQPEMGRLQRAVSAASRVLEVPERLAVLGRELRRRCQARDTCVAKLGDWRGSSQDLPRLALPSLETIDEVAARLDAAKRSVADAERAHDELERRRRDNQRERGTLEETGAVPSETDLSTARAERDAIWLRLRTAGGDAEKREGAARDYESAVRTSDDLADRLRREAERVAQRAALVAEGAALQDEQASLARQQQSQRTELAATEEEWAALWRPLGVAAGSAAEMRAWLRRIEEARGHAERVAEAETEIGELTAQVDERAASLARELAAVGEDAKGATDIAELFEIGDAAVERSAEAERRRTAGEGAIAELEEERKRAQRACDDRGAALREWQESWSESVEPLGLPAGSTPEEAQAVLEQLSDLYGQLDATRGTEKRIATMRADADRFRAQVEALVERHLPEMRGASPEEAAERLRDAYGRAVNDRRECERIDRELEERRRALTALDERREDARCRLAALVADAGVGEADQLEECERLSGEATEFDRRIAEIEDEILSAGEGASIEDLVRQTEGLDVDQAHARLGEIETAMEEVRERRENVIAKIASVENGLDLMERERGAAAAASEVQECLAGLAAHVRHYMRVKLAAAVLDREVERYRRENQGPVLTRANQLFPRLTLGRYGGLQAGVNKKDEEVLLCLRSDGTQVEVEGLSDGTRDQLYLALRLATLEHFATGNEPMPLILDDVLIHFDDDRARAALGVLGDFANSTQVLFFTHHARLLELAREVVPADRLVEHDLSAVRAPISERCDGAETEIPDAKPATP